MRTGNFKERMKMDKRQENSSQHNVQNATTRRLLTFRLDKEEYAIDLLHVQEIKAFLSITPVPYSASFIKGLVNLRGEVIPVMDLRLLFEMDELPYHRRTLMIVANVGSRVLGLIVDTVSEVITITDGDIQTASGLAGGSGVVTASLAGLIRMEDRLILVLNLDRLLGHCDSAIQERASAALGPVA